MAKLLKKKHLINSSGEEELLDIYTTKVEATQSRLPCKSILVDIDGQMTTCYIGLTDELDTPKCSSKRVQIDDKTYAERKYMGMVNFNNYMKNTYPDTYQTMTELPEDLPDTSDGTTFLSFFNGCRNLITPKYVDIRNAINIQSMYEGCSALTGSITLHIDNLSPIRAINTFYADKNLSEIIFDPVIKTELCTNMFYGCSNLTKQVIVDTSQTTDLTGLYSENINVSSDFIVDGSSCIKYVNTFYNCKKTKNITINNINNDISSIAGIVQNCEQLQTLSGLNYESTAKCTDFTASFENTKNLVDYPHLNTDSGVFFSRMYKGSNIKQIPNINTINASEMTNMFADTQITECRNLKTDRARVLDGIFRNTNLSICENINTQLCNKFSQMFMNNTNLSSELLLDFSILIENDILEYSRIDRMLYNTPSLPKVTINNCPLKITEQQFRTASSASENTEIILNYKNIKNNISPIRIIKAENMKLVDIDKTGSMSIIRKNNKPLDEYITYSGDWGTIYDDGLDFKCFITKDNFIYCGTGYNSTNRDPDKQPEIPEGIEVPNGSLKIRCENKHVYDFSGIIVSGNRIKSSDTHVVIPFFSLYQNTMLKNRSGHFIDNKGVCDYIFSGYSYTAQIFEQNKFYPTWSGDSLQNFDMILISKYNERTLNLFKQFVLYDGMLFPEELEEQLNKIKNGTTAHRIIKSKTVDIQGQPRQRLVDIDTDGDSPIRINGITDTYNLDDYIVYDTEWGTIYSDGAVTVQNLAPNTLQEYTIALEELENIQSNPVSLHSNETYTPFDFNNQQDYSNLINDINNSSLKRMSQEEINQLSTSTIPTPIQFGVTIFKDGTIYLGKAYLNTDTLRGRPAPPEGILVPNSALSILKSFDKEDMSIVFKDLFFSSTPTGTHQPLIYCNTGSSDYWLYFADENNRTLSCAYSGTYKEELISASGNTAGNKNTFYFTVKDFFGSGHDEYFGAKELKLWNRNLTKEELLLEKEPVIAMSVTRDENNPSPELTYTEELL